jgi:hypothetical protein
LKKTFLFLTFILLLIFSLDLSAQGYLVDKGFGFGYSISCLSVENSNYGLSAVGITLMGTFDIYHGFATVRKKKVEVTGFCWYFQKSHETKLFPALSFSFASYDNDTIAGLNLALFYKILDINNIRFFIVPNTSVGFENHEDLPFTPYFSIGGSLAWRFYEKISIYTESNFTFDSTIDPTVALGLLFDL